IARRILRLEDELEGIPGWPDSVRRSAQVKTDLRPDDQLRTTLDAMPLVPGDDARRARLETLDLERAQDTGHRAVLDRPLQVETRYQLAPLVAPLGDEPNSAPHADLARLQKDVERGGAGAHLHANPARRLLAHHLGADPGLARVDRHHHAVGVHPGDTLVLRRPGDGPRLERFQALVVRRGGEDGFLFLEEFEAVGPDVEKEYRLEDLDDDAVL